MTARNYHKNLSNRVRKAKAAKLIHVAKSGSYVKVQGTDASRTVTILRIGNVMEVDCQMDDFQGTCKGQYYNDVPCYHSLRAVVEVAKAKGYKVAFCISQEHATRLARIGGTVHRVMGKGQRSELWIVATKDEEVELPEWRMMELAGIEEAIKEQEAKLETNPWSMRAQKGLDALVAGRDAIKAELGL